MKAQSYNGESIVKAERKKCLENHYEEEDQKDGFIHDVFMIIQKKKEATTRQRRAAN